MTLLRTAARRLRSEERAFTLVEVMLVIVLMGIVTAIAISLWSNTVQNRRIDAATTQIKADLRLAYNSASNRLVNYRLVVPDELSQTYQFGAAGQTLTTRTVPDGVRVISSYEIVEFKPDGRVTVYKKAVGPKEDECVPPTINVTSNDGTPAFSLTIDCETGKTKVEESG